MSNGMRAFNCITRNTPLPLYYEKIIKKIDPREISFLEEKVAEDLKNRYKPEIHVVNNEILIKRPSELGLSLIRRAMMSLALTRVLMRLVDEARREVDDDGWVPLEAIEKMFIDKIYDDKREFKLNKFLLESELYKIREGGGDVYGFSINGHRVGGSSNEKRNFFAHSGFLRDMTIVRKDGEKILLKYCEEKMERVKGWLLD